MFEFVKIMYKTLLFFFKTRCVLITLRHNAFGHTRGRSAQAAAEERKDKRRGVKKDKGNKGRNEGGWTKGKVK